MNDGTPDGWAIYIAVLDTKVEKRVAGGTDPAWAPRRNELAFVGGGDRRIVLLNPQAPPPTKLLQGDRMFMKHPAWAPSGNALVFSGREWDPARNQFKMEVLYTANRDGTDLKQVVKRTKLAFLGPVWSPQGGELLYEQNVGGKEVNGQVVGGRFQLFKTNLKGGKPKQLTQHGHNIQADWFDPEALTVQPKETMLTTLWGQLKLKRK